MVYPSLLMSQTKLSYHKFDYQVHFVYKQAHSDHGRELHMDIEPGSEELGLVAPSILRPVRITSGPSHTMATMGPLAK